MSKIIAIKFNEYWIGAGKRHTDSTQWTLSKRLLKRTILRLFPGNGVLLFCWKDEWWILEIPEGGELTMYEVAMSCSHCFIHAHIVERQGSWYLEMLSGGRVHSCVIDWGCPEEE